MIWSIIGYLLGLVTGTGIIVMVDYKKALKKLKRLGGVNYA